MSDRFDACLWVPSRLGGSVGRLATPWTLATMAMSSKIFSIIILYRCQQDVGTGKLQLLDATVHLRELLRGETHLEQKTARNLKAAVGILRQMRHTLGPGVNVREARGGLKAPLHALPGGQTEREARRRAGALGRQREGTLPPPCLELLPLRGLPLQRLLLAAPLLLREALGLAALAFQCLPRLGALAVHLEGLLVLQVLLLAQLPVLHLLLTARDDLRAVRLHLVQAGREERRGGLHLHLAVQRADHTDLVHACRQQHTEPGVLAGMDELRHVVRLHARNVAAPQEKVFIQHCADEFITKYLSTEGLCVTCMLTVQVDDKKFGFTTSCLQSLRE
mmetsp:Transcript_97369/g.270846  ORF Transcript_97369/g.270846 Transcript_97369/m.270846 type:complete len:335 (+) Transcript_97369:279-1283(+)